MKEFFKKIWAWVLAHKLISGIIAGAFVAVLTVAIVVPISVNAKRHIWGDPEWSWSKDHTQATATFHCEKDGCDETHEEIATVKDGTIKISHKALATHVEDGVDKYVATVTLDEKKYSSSPELVTVKATGHVWNSFGYCSADGAYNGDQKELHGNDNNVIGEMTAGVPYYCRFEFTKMHRARYAATEILANEISFAYNNNGVPTNLDITTTDAITVENLGDDGYIYVKIIPTENKNNASLTLQEFHYGNFVGVCHGCQEFVAANSSELTVDVIKDGITLEASTTYIYRCAVLPGHTYSVTGNNLPTSELKVRYIGENGTDDVRELDLNEPFPEDSLDNYLYVRFTNTVKVTDASIAVNLVAHPYNGLGLCACGEYLGKDLVKGTPTAPFDLASQTKKFYHYVIDGEGDIAIHLEYAPGNAVSVGSMESDVYIKTDDPQQPFIRCEYNDGQNFDADWQSYDGFFKKGDELYIVITNTSNVSATNVTVTLTEE